MKQCEFCLNKEYKEKLMCCQFAELGNAVTELLKQLPLFGKDVQDFECGFKINK